MTRHFLLATAALLLLAPFGFAEDPAGYEKIVSPFLKSYCADCHSGDKPEGEFSVESSQLSPKLTDLSVRKRWSEVVNVLNSHQMPPDKSPPPKAEEVATVVDWITAQAVEAESVQRERTVVLRRLNRSEYRNTIRDLLNIDFDTSGFPEDPAPPSRVCSDTTCMAPLAAPTSVAAGCQCRRCKLNCI